MTLIRSISGIRGTIGGTPGEGLTPLDTVRYTAAFGTLIKQRSRSSSPRVVLGRDARMSGPMMRDLVVGTLAGLGFEVIDLGLASTPTVEMAVPGEKAQGGIILTASHNPAQWNALKLLNERGEFISAEEGAEVLRIAEADRYDFAPVEELGSVYEGLLELHPVIENIEAEKATLIARVESEAKILAAKLIEEAKQAAARIKDDTGRAVSAEFADMSEKLKEELLVSLMLKVKTELSNENNKQKIHDKLVESFLNDVPNIKNEFHGGVNGSV